jgi:hypothetical protein
MSRMNAVRNAAKMGAAGAVAGVGAGVASDQDASTTMKMGLAGAVGTMTGAGVGSMMPAVRGMGRAAKDAVKGMRGTSAYGSGVMNKMKGFSKYMGADMANFGSRVGASRMSMGVGALGGGMAGIGFSSNMLSSNSSMNTASLDAKFEYMKRVKKMQVDQNLRMAKEMRAMRS